MPGSRNNYNRGICLIMYPTHDPRLCKLTFVMVVVAGVTHLVVMHDCGSNPRGGFSKHVGTTLTKVLILLMGTLLS